MHRIIFAKSTRLSLDALRETFLLLKLLILFFIIPSMVIAQEWTNHQALVLVDQAERAEKAPSGFGRINFATSALLSIGLLRHSALSGNDSAASAYAFLRSTYQTDALERVVNDEISRLETISYTKIRHCIDYLNERLTGESFLTYKSSFLTRRPESLLPPLDSDYVNTYIAVFSTHRSFMVSLVLVPSEILGDPRNNWNSDDFSYPANGKRIQDSRRFTKKTIDLYDGDLHEHDYFLGVIQADIVEFGTGLLFAKNYSDCLLH